MKFFLDSANLGEIREAAELGLIDGVPFSWTRQFDVGLLYVGRAEGWDEIVYDGDPRSHNFLAFFVSGGRVLAAAGMNRDRDMAALEELMRAGRMPAPAPLRDGPVDFLKLLSDDGAGDAHGRGAALVTA